MWRFLLGWLYGILAFGVILGLDRRLRTGRVYTRLICATVAGFLFATLLFYLKTL